MWGAGMGRKDSGVKVQRQGLGELDVWCRD